MGSSVDRALARWVITDGQLPVREQEVEGSSPSPSASMINKGLFSSNSNEWATPTGFYKELDAEFHFNLDPCCTHENAKCERHYTIDNDGLTQKWGGGGGGGNESVLQPTLRKRERQVGQ